MNTNQFNSDEPVATKHDDAVGSYLAPLWASIAFTITLGIICCGVYPLIVWGIAQTFFPNQANGSLLKRDGSYTTKDSEAIGSALLGQPFSLPGYFHPRPSAAGNGYDPTSSGGSNLGPLSDKLINGLTQTTPAPATQPTTQTATTAATTQTVAAATAPTTAPTESLAFDGVRLRTLHYAMDNNISFTLFNVNPDGTRTEVPLKQFEDGQGNLNDVALVDAFPHPENDAADRVVLVADDFKSADGTAVAIPADAVTASGSGLDPHITPENAAMQAARVATARKAPVDQVNALINQYTDAPGLGILGDPGVNVLRLNLALDAKFPLPAAPAAPAAPATQPAK